MRKCGRRRLPTTLSSRNSCLATKLSVKSRRPIRRCSILLAAPTTRPRPWETGIGPRLWKSNPTCIRRGNTRKFRQMLSLNDPAEEGARRSWRRLYGDFERLGVSVEWHDFQRDRLLDWGSSFRPRSVEFCLNVEGRGAVGDRAQADYVSGSAGYYALTDQPLLASRRAGDHH